MLRRLAVAFLLAAAIAPTLQPGRVRSVRSGTPRPLSATRSFEITDKAIVTPFTLDRVLTQLIARSGVTGLTPQQLWRQLFDTQNPRPGLADPAGPHCNDNVIGGVPSFNGFLRRCPTPEGRLAATPYLDDEWFTLGIINRFDLAPADGSNCGQYRLVVAHRETSPFVRIHFIFEAVLPNANPSLGLAGCRPIAQFWSDLSQIDSMDQRRAQIEKFFFDGIFGFPPVIDPPNFAELGGVRSIHQTVPAPGLRSYQFRLAKECSGGDCTLRFVPDVLENMPFTMLFSATDTDTPLGDAFRDEFVRQVPLLAAKDVNLFHMNISKQFLMVESSPSDTFSGFVYEIPFERGQGSPKGVAFRNRIQEELNRIGSTLTPEQIVLRAEVETCVGCHGLGATNIGEGLILTPGFQGQPMISEDILADGEAGPKTRYGVDAIIEKDFLPHRMKILEEFLASGKAPVHSK
jgi:hypothetical protein